MFEILYEYEKRMAVSMSMSMRDELNILIVIVIVIVIVIETVEERWEGSSSLFATGSPMCPRNLSQTNR